jgi:hypothetical protein
MLKAMLESLGYDVADRFSSYDALQAFRTRPDSFDLVLRSSNEEADPTALMLFTESDKKVEQITLAESLPSQSGEQTEVEESDENDGPSITVIYRASLQVVKDRLEFMGFTLPLVKELFSDGVSEHLA